MFKEGEDLADQNVWTIIKDFEGLLGALLGFTLSQVFYRIGRFRVFIVSAELKPAITLVGELNELSCPVVCLDKAEFLDLHLALDLHNSQSLPVSYRDIKIIVKKGFEKHAVRISEGKISNGLITAPSKIDVYNQPAHCLERHNFLCHISGDELDFIKQRDGKVKYCLSMKNHWQIKRTMRIPTRKIRVLKPEKSECSVACPAAGRVTR